MSLILIMKTILAIVAASMLFVMKKPWEILQTTSNSTLEASPG